MACVVLNANLDRALKEHLTLKYFNRLSGETNNYSRSSLFHMSVYIMF